MASRISFTQARLEAEVERYRAECQWDKMPAIVEQMQAARIHEDGELMVVCTWFFFFKFRWLLSLPGCFLTVH